MRIRLGEADRKRLGCPEWLDADIGDITAREAATVQRLSGYSPDELAEALRGKPVFEDGKPVYETGPDGEPLTDDKGNPKQKKRWDVEAFIVLVWLALKRSGITVPYQDLDFSFDFDVDAKDPEGEPSGGKGDSIPEPTSGSSSSSTSQPSPTSSDSTPGTSTA